MRPAAGGRAHRRVDSDEADAFRWLFDRHAQAVFAFCARRTADLNLAEDLTSTVFLEAWRNRHRTGLASSPNPLPWLLGVANNVVRNDIRSRTRFRAALKRLPPPPKDDNWDDPVATKADAERALQDARRALGGLSKAERDVVTLVLWSGLTYDETAQALRIPVGTVRSRLSRARAKLHSSLPNSTVTLAEEPT